MNTSGESRRGEERRRGIKMEKGGREGESMDDRRKKLLMEKRINE